LDTIKKNFDKFMQFPDPIKQRMLGQLVYRKVQEALPRTEEESIGKITGMLIDLSVFEVAEILEFLENDDAFHSRLEEAREVLRDQSSTQANMSANQSQ